MSSADALLARSLAAVWHPCTQMKQHATLPLVPIRRGRVSVGDCVKSCVRFVEQGFKAVKVRIQIREHFLNPDPDPTFAYVDAVRRAVGPDIVLMVDANNGYSAQRAIATGRKL